jgi:hypothetical protein
LNIELNLHMNNQVSDTDSGEPLVINKNYYVQLPVSIHLINVNNIQLLHLNEINMRFYGAEYNNIERGECRVQYCCTLLHKTSY